MDGREGMRAADADREATAERLRVALEEGRLDLYEYDERLQRAYAAKTYAELDGVVVDLPGPVPAQRVESARQAGAEPPAPAVTAVPPQPAVRGHTARWLAEVWLPYLRVVGILTAIWAMASIGAREALFYWPLWVAGPWGAVLLFRTAGGLGTGEPRRMVERERLPRVERERRRQVKRDKRARYREIAAGEREPGQETSR
jgi:hypothetical protein